MVVRTSATADVGYILHRYPYSETSLLMHLWTRDNGRVVLIAKGARRPASALRSTLVPFQPLSVSFAGKGEVKSLRSAESIRVVPQLAAQALLSAFYANELLLKLTTREDPHNGIFDLYSELIDGLALASRPDRPSSAKQSNADLEPTLRAFEFALIRELGYGINFIETATHGDAVQRGRQYWLVADRGILPFDPSTANQDSYINESVAVSGDALWDITQESFGSSKTASEIKRAARLLIAHQLNGAPLHSKSLFVERSYHRPVPSAYE